MGVRTEVGEPWGAGVTCGCPHRPLLFRLLRPALLGVCFLYEPFSIVDPPFLLAPLRFIHWCVGIPLALLSNGALVVDGYCRVVLYTHVFGGRQFVALVPHYLLTSVVHKSIRVFHMPICADSWGRRRILLCSGVNPHCWVKLTHHSTHENNHFHYTTSRFTSLLSLAQHNATFSFGVSNATGTHDLLACSYNFDRPKFTGSDDIQVHDEVAMSRQLFKYENHQIV